MVASVDILGKIISGIEHVGSPNQIVIKLLEKVSTDIDIDEIAADIAKDATVSALILKTANSVRFARGERVKTIKEAVVHLGMENIKRILFAIDLIGIFKGNYVSEQFSEMDFWNHTLAGAILASKYATFKKSCNPEIAYVAALFRNIGVLAIRQFLPVEFNQILLFQNTEVSDFHALSKTFLGVSHREIAYMICQKWNLPSSIALSLRDTITPAENTKEIQDMREAILFADELLHVTKYCVWDNNYLPGNLDFHGIPCEEMFTETINTVAEMMEKFWG
jgi:HD-like signal output (HDOD) protein